MSFFFPPVLDKKKVEDILREAVFALVTDKGNYNGFWYFIWSIATPNQKKNFVCPFFLHPVLVDKKEFEDILKHEIPALFTDKGD